MSYAVISQGLDIKCFQNSDQYFIKHFSTGTYICITFVFHKIIQIILTRVTVKQGSSLSLSQHYQKIQDALKMAHESKRYLTMNINIHQFNFTSFIY